MNRQKIMIIAASIFLLGGAAMVLNLQTFDWVVAQGDYQVTMYTAPRKIQLGEMQIAFRIQSRDYRVLTDIDLAVSYRHELDNESTELLLRKGQGKDYRAWITFDKPGHYHFYIKLQEPEKEKVNMDLTIDLESGKKVSP